MTAPISGPSRPSGSAWFGARGTELAVAADGSWKLAKGTLSMDDFLKQLMVENSRSSRAEALNQKGMLSAQRPKHVQPFFRLKDTDEVKNYEIGWKTELFDNSLRFNGSAFFVEVDGLQTTIFDPNIVNLFFSDNAANAEIQGVEGDFTWAPASVEGLTVAGAFSFLDTEVTEVLVPTNDVLVGSDLAFAPAYQGNLRVRYEWDLEKQIAGQNLVAHVMPQVVFSDSSYSDIIEINKMELDGYVTLGATAGVTGDNWGAEIYASNLTNEYAELSGSFVYDRERITPIRPRTIGIRVSYDY